MRRRLFWAALLVIVIVLKREGLLSLRGVRMPRAHPNQPLRIECELCGDKIPSVRHRAWMEAIDHALDKHRAKLLAEPENARRYFRVVNPETGKQARVAPSSPQEPASS